MIGWVNFSWLYGISRVLLITIAYVLHAASNRREYIHVLLVA